MNTIAVTNARGQLSELINKVAYAKERISLTRQNRCIPAPQRELITAG